MATGELRAAAGAIDITPTQPVYIAGYGTNRRSVGVHDPLMARCLALESEGIRLAFVSCDLLGLPRFQVEQIRVKVQSVVPEHLYLAATHTHSGPDTFGQWGPDPQTSGVDSEWLASLHSKIAQLVDATTAQLQPAVLKFAQTTQTPRLSKNICVPQILDTELAAMQALSRDTGQVIATCVHYACHPEILNNRYLTADFPHWLYARVEHQAGGICLFLNGALGGMVTADFDETTAPPGENRQAAEKMGTRLGERALEILQAAETLSVAPIQAQRRVFRVPMENERFKALIANGIFPNSLFEGDQIETEVSRIVIGPAEFLTLPGEVLPNIGFYLKRLMTGRPKFLLGLTNDELGYILTPEDYGLELYAYETSVSVGPEIAPRMEENLRDLMA